MDRPHGFLLARLGPFVQEGAPGPGTPPASRWPDLSHGDPCPKGV